jgi:hypothetical protein
MSLWLVRAGRHGEQEQDVGKHICKGLVFQGIKTYHDTSSGAKMGEDSSMDRRRN